jgi:hypothetical protein
MRQNGPLKDQTKLHFKLISNLFKLNILKKVKSIFQSGQIIHHFRENFKVIYNINNETMQIMILVCCGRTDSSRQS